MPSRTYAKFVEAVHLCVLILHLDVLVGRDVSRRRTVRGNIALSRHLARVGYSPCLDVVDVAFDASKSRAQDSRMVQGGAKVGGLSASPKVQAAVLA